MNNKKNSLFKFGAPFIYLTLQLSLSIVLSCKTEPGLEQKKHNVENKYRTKEDKKERKKRSNMLELVSFRKYKVKQDPPFLVKSVEFHKGKSLISAIASGNRFKSWNYQQNKVISNYVLNKGSTALVDHEVNLETKTLSICGTKSIGMVWDLERKKKNI